MKMILSLTLISLILIITGCTTVNTTIIQKDEAAFLKLTGNLENVTMQIDDGSLVQVDPEKPDVVYQIKPGTHIVTIFRAGEIVVQRELYFDDKITREIDLR
ncbi:MAG: hypothetical protein K9N06_03695 [Candidatus Cloacimonetes bacterium]|nr:hypothetical protein [Candidatus Cloacimonadota bacterium]